MGMSLKRHRALSISFKEHDKLISYISASCFFSNFEIYIYIYQEFHIYDSRGYHFVTSTLASKRMSKVVINIEG